MRHFVAYHNVDKMGVEFKDHKPFQFRSRKRESYLSKTIGSSVWVFSGKTDGGKKMYYLEAVFYPDKIYSDSEKQDLIYIEGAKGHYFEPPVNVNRFSWVMRLLKKQSNFSLGINEIQDDEVIDQLSLLLNTSSVSQTVKSKVPDEDLSPYNLVTRYCILHGMTMEEAAELWNNQFKGRDLSQSQLLNDLFNLLSREDRTSNIEKPEYVSIRKSFAEGELIQKECTRRTRNPGLVDARLRIDRWKCQSCGFPPVSIKHLVTDETLLDVHHVDPLADGKRETKLDDLVTLCPNCHRLIHTLGRIHKEDRLTLEFLKRKTS